MVIWRKTALLLQQNVLLCDLTTQFIRLDYSAITGYVRLDLGLYMKSVLQITEHYMHTQNRPT